MPKLFPAAPRGVARTDRPAGQLIKRAVTEALEGRRFLSVSADTNGFTVVTPPRDARIIHVSSSAGDDDNSGSAASPVRSLREAASRLRDNTGDQMLLRRGDVWRETLGRWDKSGANDDNPMVVGAYGTGDRPRLDTGADTALTISGWNDVEHLSVLGIAFHADARDPESPRFTAEAAATGNPGLVVARGAEDLLIEDCVVRHYATNVLAMDDAGGAGGGIRDITIRRTQVVDAYSATSRHSQGLYAQGVRGLTLEENVFDHNGWNEVVAGAAATQWNHNAYLAAENTGVVVRGNLFARASNHGLQARAGGDVQDNVFLNNPTAMSYGLVRGDRDPAPDGVSGVVNGNVFLGTASVGGAMRGTAIEIANTKPGVPTVLSNNVFSHDNRDGRGFPAITLVYPEDDGGVGLNDLTVQGNVVYRWSSAFYVQQGIQPGGTGKLALNRLAVRDNDFVRIENDKIVRHEAPLDPAQERWSGNRYDGAGSEDDWVVVEWRDQDFDRWTDRTDDEGRATRPAYAGPERTAATYSASLGGAGTADAFLETARAQSREAWRPEYATAAFVQYVRDGFEEPGRAVPRSWLAPTAPAAVANLPVDGMTVTTEDTSVTFTVTYTDDKRVDVASLGDGDVRFVRRDDGRALPATLVAVDDPNGDGTGPVTATYRVAAPDAAWRLGDAGRYRAAVQADEVRDAEGFIMGGGPVGQVTLTVNKAPDPPRVARLKASLPARKPHAVAVKFTSDVYASLAAGDLVVTAEDGTMVDVSTTAGLSWDAATLTATWTFPRLPGGVLPAGRYHLSLPATGVADADGRALDGNKDGVAGDAFSPAKWFKVKGLPAKSAASNGPGDAR